MSTVEGERGDMKYMKDRERLLEAAEALLGNLKELETEKIVLEEKLRSSEVQQEELKQKLAAAFTLIKTPKETQMENLKVDDECISEIRELRSAIQHLLSSGETPGERGAVDIKELRSSLSRLLTSGDMTR